MSKDPLVFERLLNAPVERVWQAITDPEAMKQWYFDLPGFKAETGYSFRFTGTGKDDSCNYLHLCEVTEVVEGRKLSYSWRYDGYEGNSLVSFELFPEGDQTRIVLTHTGLESFRINNNPNLDPESFSEGWGYFIHTALKDFVEAA
jgi:uncharacterized protein YndB with AHSA1/START domain